MSRDGTAIRLHGVSKKYPIYARNLDRVIEALHPLRRQYHRDFWALRDVNLEVGKGETLGIIGVNGSGKSTLLQIICSILQPSSGKVEVNGRVSALIELGAGFNPELTGRQNAEMNCMISGLSVRDAQEVLPAIESFADIGQFFDQPVNTYSSGMFMRVAFATAVHVEPEILVIDEALAVGDARFQQKCFRKFREFQVAGKTILLVTHDRYTIPRLCTTAVMLNAGRIVESGDPARVTDRYGKFLQLGDRAFLENDPGDLVTLEPETSTSKPMLDEEQPVSTESGGKDICHLNPTYNRNELRFGQGGAAIVDYRLSCGGQINPQEAPVDGPLQLRVIVRYDRAVQNPLVGVTAKTTDGVIVSSTNSKWLGQSLRARQAGEIAEYRFDMKLHLAAGNWFFDLAIAEDEATLLDTREGIIHLYVKSVRRMIGLASLEASVSESS